MWKADCAELSRADHDLKIVLKHSVAEVAKPQKAQAICRIDDHREHPLQVMTVVACVGWMGVSSALIMINKYLMSTDGFRYPMALSCLGMLFSSVASYVACRVGLLHFSAPATHHMREAPHVKRCLLLIQRHSAAWPCSPPPLHPTPHAEWAPVFPSDVSWTA